MKYYHYICVHCYLITDEVMDEYNLHIETNRHIYFVILRGMYGLKQAGIIYSGQLFEKPAPYGYDTMNYTTGIC